MKTLPPQHPFTARFSAQTRRGALLAAGLAGIICLFPQARAQTSSTWSTEAISSGGTVAWSTAGKWTPAAPVAGTTVNLNFGNLTATTAALTLQNNIGAFNIYQMTLANATTATVTYTRSVSGNVYTFVQDGSGHNPEIISNGGNNTQNLSFAPVIASGATLQIIGTSTGLIGNTSVISGGGGINLNKPGTFLASTANTFLGDFTLTQGDLALAIDTVGSPGSVTSGPLGRGNVILNGGTLRASSVAQRTLGNNVQIGGNFTIGAASTSNKSVTLEGTTLLTGTGVTRTITGAFTGSAAADTNTATFSGAITEAGAGDGIIFSNSSVTKIVLSGINTYTGDTTVNSGQLTLSDNAGLKFTIGANGVNNKILGTGTLLLDGDFTFDLSGAGTALGNSWNIVNVSTLAETFSATFTVNGFTDIGGNLWEKTNVNGGRTYQFDEATGLLSVTAIPEPTTWALLVTGLTFAVVMRRRQQG